MRRCIETKLTLSAAVYRFECELLHLSGDFGVLKYIIGREYNVHGIALRPGDITYGLYWRGRPYTLYVWPQPRGRSVYYFNIADSVSLSTNEFVWRDLTVDVLIDAGGGVHVLDENELPDSLSGSLLEFIAAAKNNVLRSHPEIIREADAALATLA